MANENAGSLQLDASQDPGNHRDPRPPSRYASTPSYESPQRHHRRDPIARRQVKETLNARSEYTTSQDDGTAEHRINQYVIKQEIGRGSFGAVHIAVDQYGNEFAVKEFSKSRLRKRAQSHLLRRPRGPKRSSDGFNSPLHRRTLAEDHKENALYLIREEIAIMKKLHHSNLVSLIEVLDDPTEDSLYMVMEMCKKGVIMKVGLEERADPYDDESCRCWFRDLILGIEYLHAQGIVHRDIKPDNCLLTSDDILKVVDFGVSEMFEKNSDMFTAKSAGSPAFLPPELCVVKHGDVSGKAADIWSMGVTLYCLRYGKLPFEKQSIFELYEAIRNDPVICEGEINDDFKGMMFRILEKDPAKRISMDELREHPWVTKNGVDPLLLKSENTAEIVGSPTKEEMDTAITRNIGQVLAVMKAVRNFKRLLGPSRAGPPMQSILGQEYECHFVEPPMEMEPEESVTTTHSSHFTKSKSLNTYNRTAFERENVIKGYHQQRREVVSSQMPDTIDSSDAGSGIRVTETTHPERKDSGSLGSKKPWGESVNDVQAITTPQSASPQMPLSRASSATTKRSIEGTRGHARDPLQEEFPFLFIGPSTYTGSTPPKSDEISKGVSILTEPDETSSEMNLSVDPAYVIVSESPGAAEFDIYETAYRKEVERIRTGSLPRQRTTPKVYLTRRVDGKGDMMKLVRETTTEADSGIGRKIPVPSGLSFDSALSTLRSQLQQNTPIDLPQNLQATEITDEGQPATFPEIPTSVEEPTTSSTFATINPTSPSSENPKAKLRSLLDRVRGPRGS